MLVGVLKSLKAGIPGPKSCGSTLMSLVSRIGLIIAMAVVGCWPAVALAQPAPNDRAITTWYDAANRVVGTVSVDPDGIGPLPRLAERRTYNDRGFLTKVENGSIATLPGDSTLPANWPNFILSQSTDYEYDNWGNRIKITVSAGGQIETVTQLSYDEFSRLKCTALRMNKAVFASLPTDACVQGAEGIDGPDRITQKFYDSTDHIVRIQKGIGTSLVQDEVTYTRSIDGRPLTVVDANGNKASYTYDGQGRPTKWSFPSKTSPGTVSTTDYESYSYDNNGNRLSLRKRDGQVINYSYDALNRMTLKDVPGGTTLDVYYGYDLQGLQLYARFGSTSGQGLTNVYDGFGRLTSASTNQGGTTRSLSYQYDADGNRTRVTHPDGNYFTYDYDLLNRLTTIKQSGSTSIAVITYDAQGRRSGDTKGAVTTSYGYDAISRLASLSDNLSGTSDDVARSYSYNPASQLITASLSNNLYVFSGLATVSRSYTVNGLNQYQTAGPATFTYDANGNLTGDGTNSYAYDVENRLTSAGGGLSASLTYDPSGRLYQVTGASSTTRFVYDGDQLTLEYDASGNILRRYVHGTGEDDPLIWYEGATVGTTNRRSLQSDHQGSIVSIADATGVRLAIDSYDEYGIPGSGNIGRFQYTGQAWLPELGMYYYKARIYSPTLGRFLQTDPIGYEDQFNLYAYVANDPVNGRDPSGEGKFKWFVETAKGIWKRVGQKQALSARRAGKNVSARGPGQVSKGKRLEEKVQGSKGAVEKHSPHPDSNPKHRGSKETHFQPANRKTGGQGHTFVGPPAAGAASGLTIAGTMRDFADKIGTASDNLDKDSSPFDRAAAEAWDYFDPASNLADALRAGADLIDPEN